MIYLSFLAMPDPYQVYSWAQVLYNMFRAYEIQRWTMVAYGMFQN